jgi:hypothetical protein
VSSERIVLIAVIAFAVCWLAGFYWWNAPPRLSAKGAGVLIGAFWFLGASWWMNRGKRGA